MEPTSRPLPERPGLVQALERYERALSLVPPELTQAPAPQALPHTAQAQASLPGERLEAAQAGWSVPPSVLTAAGRP